MAHGRKKYKRYRPDLLLRIEKILFEYSKDIVYPPELAKKLKEPVVQVVECLDKLCEMSAQKQEKRVIGSFDYDRFMIYCIGDKYRITGNRPPPRLPVQTRTPTKCQMCGEEIKRTHKKSEFHSKHKCTDKMIKNIIEE